MDRPDIICRMVTSLDGKVTGGSAMAAKLMPEYDGNPAHAFQKTLDPLTVWLRATLRAWRNESSKTWIYTCTDVHGVRLSGACQYHIHPEGPHCGL